VLLATQNAVSLARVLGNSDRATRLIHMCEILRQLIRSKADAKWQIGKVGELEEVEEYRVEAMCLGKDTAVKAVEALKG
jgi:hypothetical protein